MVADLGVGLVARAHVGADAAVVEHVDAGAENRLDEAVAVEFIGVAFERRADFGAEGDLLEAPAEDAAAVAYQRGIVIGPSRTGLVVEPLALVVAFGGIGIGIEKNVAMVEGGEELHVARVEEAVAEDVARHVADTDDRDGRAALDVAAHLAQMALGRFPCAARGNRHFLVVVAVLAARGEGVAEPEAAALGDRVGNIGETCRALVGGDDEIGPVGIEDADARGMNGLAADDVVGEIEHRIDQRLVGVDAGVAVRRPARA